MEIEKSPATQGCVIEITYNKTELNNALAKVIEKQKELEEALFKLDTLDNRGSVIKVKIS